MEMVNSHGLSIVHEELQHGRDGCGQVDNERAWLARGGGQSPVTRRSHELSRSLTEPPELSPTFVANSTLSFLHYCLSVSLQTLLRAHLKIPSGVFIATVRE
ncbi:hypothetical protein J6590_012912 [Homalodisca vitripennis]|nr:hypothetical protein J6590_012912 [Homalodisca vitripennis]